MNVVPLLDSLSRVQAPYHLENGNGWKVLPGPATCDQTKDLVQLTEELQKEACKAPMTLKELDHLATLIEGLSLSPVSAPHTGLFSLFSRTITPPEAEAEAKKRELAAKQKFKEAVDSHKNQVQLNLERISRQHAFRRDFASVKELVRGAQYTIVYSSLNRIQINFLLNCPADCLKKVAPREVLNVSGIQRVTVELLSHFTFHKRGNFSYCPNITRHSFVQLLNPSGQQFEELSVHGCPQVDDQFLEAHPLVTQANWFRGRLCLEFTNVSNEMIERLQRMQPRATFVYTPSYISTRLRIAQGSFGLDRQGLSEEAAEALLLFIFTRNFPNVALPVAMEIAASNNTIIRDPDHRQKFKDYCRYILQINVDRHNVQELHAFALRTSDAHLVHICKMFVETFFSPELQGVSDDEKRICSAILSAPSPPEPNFYCTGSELYFIEHKQKQIEFSPECAPLYDLILRDDFVNFANAFKRSPESRRSAYLRQLMEEQPKHPWLALFVFHGERACSFIPDREEAELPKMLDLRDLDPRTIQRILKEFKSYNKLQCKLNCTQKQFCETLELCNYNFGEVALLDLRECKDLDWIVIERYLLGMKHLQNFLLPPNLLGLNSDTKLSASWTWDMYPIVACNLIHVLATKKDQKTVLDAPRDFQCIHLANSILMDLPTNVNFWRYAWKNLAGVFLLATTRHGKVVQFPCDMDFSGMDILTPELLTKHTFQKDLLRLRFDYNSSFTAKSLRILAQRPVQNLSLYGCSQVDDSFIEHIPRPAGGIGSTNSLDLRGTQVTLEGRKRLQDKGYSVQIDEEYLPLRKVWQTKEVNDPVFHAISHFTTTGYYPLLTVPLAKKIIESQLLVDKERLERLKNFSATYLELNIQRENVLELYHFAEKLKLPSLLATCRYFMEIFCNPYYPQLPHAKEDEALFGPVFSDPPPHAPLLPAVLHGQKVEPLHPRTNPVKASPAVRSANFGASPDANNDL